MKRASGSMVSVVLIGNSCMCGILSSGRRANGFDTANRWWAVAYRSDSRSPLWARVRSRVFWPRQGRSLMPSDRLLWPCAAGTNSHPPALNPMVSGQPRDGGGLPWEPCDAQVRSFTARVGSRRGTVLAYQRPGCRGPRGVFHRHSTGTGSLVRRRSYRSRPRRSTHYHPRYPSPRKTPEGCRASADPAACRQQHLRHAIAHRSGTRSLRRNDRQQPAPAPDDVILLLDLPVGTAGPDGNLPGMGQHVVQQWARREPAALAVGAAPKHAPGMEGDRDRKPGTASCTRCTGTVAVVEPL